MKTLHIIVLTLIMNFVQGQNSRTDSIDAVISSIESSSKLTTKEFDAVDVYQHTFDGGGLITIKYDDDGLRVIKQEIGLSFGRVSTYIYLDKGMPIKLIEIEENFALNADQTGWDYSSLHQVFKASFWIYNWDMDLMDVTREGKRNLSEGTCSIYEYSPLIELGEELMKK